MISNIERFIDGKTVQDKYRVAIFDSNTIKPWGGGRGIQGIPCDWGIPKVNICISMMIYHMVSGSKN